MKSSSYYAVAMEKFERELLSRALEAHQWNRRQTAKFLGISYRAIFYRIVKLNLISPRDRERILRTAEQFGVTENTSRAS